MSIISDIFAGGASTLVNSVSGLLSNVVTTKKESMTLDNDIRKAELTHEEKIAEINAGELNTVNATMQAESKSEHWIQWFWRPFVGLIFAFILINNYIILPYVHSAVLLPIPSEVWTAILVILGAASAGRSWEKVTKINAK